MINSLNFSLFPSDELLTFAKGALALVEPRKNGSPVIIPFFDRALEQQNNFIIAFEREIKNPFTKQLAVADQKLDFSFLAFRSYIEAISYRVTMPDMAESAGKILEVIRKHGWSAASMGYKAEAATITNLISELQDKYTNELHLISAIDWLREMEATLQAFEELVKQQVTNSSVSEPTLSRVRPELVRSLKALFSIISLTQEAIPADELATLEALLNELIVRSLATVKAAGTRAENKKKEEEQPK